jgi:alanyl-tRNA synthetase
MVEMGGPFSRELCGGTHVASSGQIGLIDVLGESSIGAGVRRIEALVSTDAWAHLAKERALVSDLATMLKVQPDQVAERVEKMIAQLKAAEKTIAEMRQKELMAQMSELAGTAIQVGRVKLIAQRVPGVAGGDLRAMALELRNRMGDAPTVVALVGGDTKPVVTVVTNEAARELGAKAGALVSRAAEALGGRGGGKDDVAQGGGTEFSGSDSALAVIRQLLAKS